MKQYKWTLIFAIAAIGWGGFTWTILAGWWDFPLWALVCMNVLSVLMTIIYSAAMIGAWKTRI